MTNSENANPVSSISDPASNYLIVPKRLQEALGMQKADPKDTWEPALWEIYQEIPPDRSVSFAQIWRSEIDALTYRLESQGFKAWFTCEVDGVEYRLVARTDRSNPEKPHELALALKPPYYLGAR